MSIITLLRSQHRHSNHAPAREGIHERIATQGGFLIRMAAALSLLLFQPQLAAANQTASRLVSTRSDPPGWIGAQFSDTPPNGAGSGDGAFVFSVEKNSPAEAAGFRAGDLLTQVNGKSVRDQLDAASAIRDAGPDCTLLCRVIRDGKPKVLLPRTSLPGELRPAPVSTGNFVFDSGTTRVAETAPEASAVPLQDLKVASANRASVNDPNALPYNCKMSTATLNGQTYTAALCMGIEDRFLYQNGQSECEVEYLTERRYSRFRALVGVSDDAPAGTTMVYRLIGDGRELFCSKTLHVGSEPERLDVDTTGVLRLTLRADSNHEESPAVWVNPRLYQGNNTPHRTFARMIINDNPIVDQAPIVDGQPCIPLPVVLHLTGPLHFKWDPDRGVLNITTGND